MTDANLLDDMTTARGGAVTSANRSAMWWTIGVNVCVALLVAVVAFTSPVDETRSYDLATTDAAQHVADRVLVELRADRAARAHADRSNRTTTTTSTTTTTARRRPQPVKKPVQKPATAPRVRYTGALPPLSVKLCESGGDYKAENPRSTASGAWQIIDGTWDGYGGYSHAADAPPEVQDDKARQLWANGAGASHWASCL